MSENIQQKEQKIGGFNLKIATMLLAFSMFSTGASGLVNEYVLATVSTYILGNSIEQWSIIIALMMLMMGVASYLQRHISSKLLIEKFVVIEIVIALLGGFAPIAIYAAHANMQSHFMFVHYFFVMAIGFLIGFEVPLVVRINDKHGIKLSTNLGIIYFMDYVGACIGAFVWVYVLLKNFPLTEISFIVAGFNFLVAIFTFIYFVKHAKVKRTKTLALTILFVVLSLVFGYQNNRNWNLTLEQKLYDDPIVFSKTTKYQHLVLTHRKLTDDYRLYINGNIQFSSLDEAIYHEMLVHPVMTAAAVKNKVLVLGGGDGMALREILKYHEVKQVMLVDLDPDMIKLAKDNPDLARLNKGAFKDARVVTKKSSGVSDGESMNIYQPTGIVDRNRKEEFEKVATVKIINIDADMFLANVKETFDIIIVDLPDPYSPELVKLYSKEFYRKAYRVLNAGGMMVVQSTSPYFAKESWLTIGRTIKAAGFNVLPYHENVPSFGEWGWHLCWNTAHGNEQIINLIEEKGFDVNRRYLNVEIFKASTVFPEGWLKTKRVEINTLMNPVLLQTYLDEDWKID